MARIVRRASSPSGRGAVQNQESASGNDADYLAEATRRAYYAEEATRSDYYAEKERAEGESDIDLAMRQEQQAESLLESAIIRALKQEEMAREIITRVLPALSGKSLDKVLIAVLNVLRTR